MPRIKWVTKDEIIGLVNAIIDIMDSLTETNKNMILLLIIWLYELFVKIMISQYDRFNDNNDHTSDPMIVDLGMIRRLIRENEVNDYKRRQAGLALLNMAEPLRHIRNHIAHYKLGIESMYITVFADYSMLIITLLNNAVNYNKILKSSYFDRFRDSYINMINRCLCNDISNETVKKYFNIHEVDVDKTGLSSSTSGSDILSKYLNELDNKR